jgi:hypothetical protein
LRLGNEIGLQTKATLDERPRKAVLRQQDRDFAFTSATTVGRLAKSSGMRRRDWDP